MYPFCNEVPLKNARNFFITLQEYVYFVNLNYLETVPKSKWTKIIKSNFDTLQQQQQPIKIPVHLLILLSIIFSLEKKKTYRWTSIPILI